MKTDNRHKIIGGKHRALSRYYMILNRLKNTDRKHNAGYKGIEVKFTKDEFVEWFKDNDFDGCSVDRIDNNGHYSMDNIQLITIAENIRKDHTKAKDGLCECFSCKEVKPLCEFVKESRRFNGYSTICKPCERERGRDKYRRLNNA